MAAFSYSAINNSGKTVKGVMEGDSERQVRSQLRLQQLKPLKIVSVADAEKAATQQFSFLKRSRRLSSRELSLVTRQLASLVQSGLPLDETLRVAAKQARKQNTKGILLQTRSRVVEGRSLAQAFGENPKAFNNMYRAMVRAGESTGFLGAVLERLAEYTESSQHIRQKVQSAMVYPIVLLCISITVVGFLMAFVVPKLTTIFEHSNHDLPFLTTALIASSNFVSSYYGLVALIAFISAIGGFVWWLRDDKHRMTWHRLLLKVPFISYILVQADSARFSATLSILLGSGVPLIEALRIAGEVLENLVLRKACTDVAIAVQEGSSLNRALDRADIFPPLLVQMVASGEANGTLAKQLDYAARNQERELEMILATAMSLLEPLSVVIMGGIVLTIVIAILLPMLQINTFV